jgi:vacuolar-type H+-ATPase subunit E/Vma4
LEQAAALEPLKSELLRRAQAVVAERLEQAAAEDAATIAAAEREATLIVEQARQEGVSEATVWLAAQRARSRRQARALILRARAEALEQLRRQCTAAVARLISEPDYPRLRERLVENIRAQLGEQAVISEAATGGIMAIAPGRQLDCSFGTLVEQLLTERVAQPNMPWTT